jgi:PiT family inorganic phosphate transporter
MGIDLATLATCFVFVCGANDGGALLALAVRHGEVSTFGVPGLLLAAIVTRPTA